MAEAMTHNDAWPRIHRKADGLLMVQASGHARFMTRWEAFKFRFLRHVPAFLTDDVA